MHSTHDVNCKICGKSLAFWSGFRDNMQFADEYECQGEIRRKYEHWHFGKTTSNCKPTQKYMIEEYGKVMKVKHHMTEMWPCHLENYTQFCADCAKKLKYKCPVCGGRIILTRKR